MRKYILYMVCLGSFLMITNKSFADYPLGKGRSALTANFNYFHSNKFFDENAKMRKFLPGDYFQSTLYGLTLVTGIGRNVDLTLSVPFVSQNNITSGVKTSNAGLGDMNALISFHFPSELRTKSFTLKAGVIMPLYQNDSLSTPFLGFGSRAVQLAAAYSFSPMDDVFATVDFTYTRFLDEAEGPNQYRGTLSLSRMLNLNTVLSGSFVHQASRSANTGFSQNLLINKNFEGGTINLVFSKRITRTITPSIQGFYTLYGKNMGLGLGATFFVSIRIP